MPSKVTGKFNRDEVHESFDVQPEDILVHARTYLGTPFHHQARVKGHGVDCIGLITGVGRDLYGDFHDSTNYPRDPDPEDLLHHLRVAFFEVKKYQVQTGDLVVFYIGCPTKPQHVGILSEYRGRRSLIHTHDGLKRGVCEVSLSETWQKRIMYGFRYPGVK